MTPKMMFTAPKMEKENLTKNEVTQMEKIFPELMWIKDTDLRDKMRKTFMDGLEQGGWPFPQFSS